MENMNKKYTIKEFVEKFEKLSSDQLKENMIKSIISREYAPVLEKKVVLDAMFEKSLMEKDGIKYVDKFLLNINMTFAILCLYTTFQFDKDGGVLFDDYDLLVKHNIFDIILMKIGKREISELTNIVNNIEETFDNMHTFEAYIAGQITRFSTMAGIVTKSGYEQLNKTLNDDKTMSKISENITNTLGELNGFFKGLVK